mmetsp:Transcript_27031/g.108192  ORF Transcript_27031/g.108192 Transcript_27031/m.108192 type:complete len:204 (+) Transcript_27031:1320-1931(+)
MEDTGHGGYDFLERKRRAAAHFGLGGARDIRTSERRAHMRERNKTREQQEHNAHEVRRGVQQDALSIPCRRRWSGRCGWRSVSSCARPRSSSRLGGRARRSRCGRRGSSRRRSALAGWQSYRRRPAAAGTTPAPWCRRRRMTTTSPPPTAVRRPRRRPCRAPRRPRGRGTARCGTWSRSPRRRSGGASAPRRSAGRPGVRPGP